MSCLRCHWVNQWRTSITYSTQKIIVSHVAFTNTKNENDTRLNLHKSSLLLVSKFKYKSNRVWINCRIIFFWLYKDIWLFFVWFIALITKKVFKNVYGRTWVPEINNLYACSRLQLNWVSLQVFSSVNRRWNALITKTVGQMLNKVRKKIRF